MSGEAKKEKIANGKPVGRKALLSDFIEKQVSIITNDGRLVIGRLRGFDQVCNVILEKCVERVFAKDCGVQVVSLGLYVIRGDNIAVVGEVDTDKDANVNWADVKITILESMETVIEAFVKVLSTKPSNRPIVTLTWAQSLDGRLSAAPGERTAISGPSTRQMTHVLRAVHDGILVGANTVVTDKPRLSTRLTSESTTWLSNTLNRLGGPPCAFENPVPVILDTHLRTPSSTPCLHTDLPNSRLPLIFTTASEMVPSLKQCAHVIPSQAAADGKLGVDLNSTLQYLAREGINSIMVEGGASVLSSFVSDGLWDLAVVTVAPSLFGVGAAMAGPESYQGSFKGVRLAYSRWLQLGDDGVVVGYRQ